MQSFTSVHTGSSLSAAAAGREFAALRPTGLSWAVAVTAVAFSATLTWISQSFGYETDVEDMPSLWLVALLVTAGGVFAITAPRFAVSAALQSSDMQRKLFGLVVASGLIARVILFASVPALEDDYNRYLWDGAVAAHGISPYAHSPLAVFEGRAPAPLPSLGRQSNDVLDRINHKSLTTIYPPVAQAAFAISYAFKPFSLAAWRTLLLLCDIATLVCLAALLDRVGRSRLWVALYWLNPVVLKEVFNSGHMEGILLPFVLLTLLLAVRQRLVLATMSLGLAAGVKFWPLLLAPVILRSLWESRARLFLAGAILCGLMGLWLAPMLLTVSVGEPGLIAYVDRWTTNSALFPAFETAIARLLTFTGAHQVEPGLAARVIIALALAAISIALAWKPIKDTSDLIWRSSIVVASIVLLSPAQYPWYTVWFAPFLVFHPYRAFLLLSALIPIYYAKFYLVAHDQGALFESAVVWTIWAPVFVVTLAGIKSTISSLRTRRLLHSELREA